MAWTAITKPTQGDSTKKTSFADAVIDNLSHLFNLVGGGGVGVTSGVNNGGFENDTDSDGAPDGWTATLYTGGSVALDTATPMQGAASWKFTSPGGAGNGGAYADTDDYTVCSPGSPLRVDALLRCSAADIHVVMQLLWYDKDKAYVSTTDLYDEATANPTSARRFAFVAIPPATAMFCKLRLTGGKNDDTTSGSATFDGIAITPSNNGVLHAVFAEATSTSESYTDEGTATLILPVVSSAGHIRLTLVAECKSANGLQRFKIGSTYSNELAGAAGYTKGVYEIDLFDASGGSVTLTQQLMAVDGVGTTYGKKVGTEVYVEVLHA